MGEFKYTPEPWKIEEYLGDRHFLEGFNNETITIISPFITKTDKKLILNAPKMYKILKMIDESGYDPSNDKIYNKIRRILDDIEEK